ncbi:DUF7711 family protein [Actinokineospora sp. G85]|uniref:DUF7711 family protein n=1 Tax=Actinokineospora sp. G85 TaxID=3406626 RepID=UPI003C72F020
MKWNRAVHHVETLAAACAEMAAKPATIFPLRVVGLWVAGELLGPATDDVDSALVALEVDLPAEEVPWLVEPAGSAHWGNAVKLAQSPLTVRWRSAHAPVWNHMLERPARVWTVTNGLVEDALAALGAGEGERVREPAPADWDARMAAELRISHVALAERTAAYQDRRWRPGKLEPVADALWQASSGYLDVLSVTKTGKSWAEQV